MIEPTNIDEDIYTNGFCIIDNFLTDIDYQNLQAILQTLYQNDSFKSAKIGQHSNAKQVPTIRNDQIYWLDEEMQAPAIKAYFTGINSIKTILNQSLFLGLNNIEAHFAVYKPGSFYKKHVDQFATTQDRRISCVYYLNHHWQPEHGGELMLYHQNDLPPILIEPFGNRLVCFNSDLPHEVSITYEMRYSIAGWLKSCTFSLI